LLKATKRLQHTDTSIVYILTQHYPPNMTEYSILIPQSLKTHVQSHLGTYQRAGTLLALSLFFGGSAHLWQQGLSPFPAMAVALPGNKLAEDRPSPSLDEILEGVFARHGGPDSPHPIKTFQKSGELSRHVEENTLLEGTQVQVDYTFTHPNLAIHRLSNGEYGVRMGFDGSEHWLEKINGSSQETARALTPTEREIYRINHNLALPAGVLLKDRNNLYLAGLGTVDGRLCHVVAHSSDEGVEQRFYIDGETFTVLKRSLEGKQQVELVYGQFRRIDDWLLPHEETLYKDGLLQSRLVLHTYRINGGKLTYLAENADTEKPETALAGR
jgi:hypothetical protein